MILQKIQAISIKNYLIHSNEIPATVLYLVGLSAMLYGFFTASLFDVIEGVWNIILSPSNLITDYFVVGGIGATFVNAGLLLCLNTYVTRRSGSEIGGAQFAALMCVMAFSFFGKNVYNTIPLTLGSWLYSHYIKESYRTVLLTSLFATGLSPVVSLISFGQGLTPVVGVPLGCLLGIVTGFIMPPLASNFLRFHQGFSLYNVGFACGVISMILAGIMRAFHLQVDTPSSYLERTQNEGYWFLLGLCMFFIALGFWSRPHFLMNYKQLIQRSGRTATDFMIVYGTGTIYINIGLMGLIAMAYVYCVGGVLNGPVIGGILMIMGFSALGKHIKNCLPIIFGVYVTQILMQSNTPDQTGAILAALFGTTLAPIAGQYGIIAGVIAGAVHATLTQNIFDVHGGLDLYHNGFDGAFIAAALVPVLDVIKDRRRN